MDGDFKLSDCFLINKVVSCSAIEESNFGHFCGTKRKSDIDTIVVANIHGTYL
jgi:hypothetical protein